MTASFLCAACRIDNHVIDQQASYIEGWMKALKDDKTLFIRAAGQAKRATDLIFGRELDRDVAKSLPVIANHTLEKSIHPQARKTRRPSLDNLQLT